MLALLVSLVILFIIFKLSKQLTIFPKVPVLFASLIKLFIKFKAFKPLGIKKKKKKYIKKIV